MGERGADGLTVDLDPAIVQVICSYWRAMKPLDRITWNPDQMNGQPCVRGMRLTVRRVLAALAMYPDRAELFRNYPELEEEDLRQALAFAAANLEDKAEETPAA